MAITFRTAGRAAIITAALISAGTSAAAAQVSVGAVLGVNRTNLSGDKPEGTSFSSLSGGLIAGLVLEIPVAKDVAIMFQPGYRQSGANIGFQVDGQEERDRQADTSRERPQPKGSVAHRSSVEMAIASPVASACAAATTTAVARTPSSALHTTSAPSLPSIHDSRSSRSRSTIRRFSRGTV